MGYVGTLSYDQARVSKEGRLSVNEVTTSRLPNSFMVLGADKGLCLDGVRLEAADSRDALDPHRTLSFTSGTRSFPWAPGGTIDRSRFVGEAWGTDADWVREWTN